LQKVLSDAEAAKPGSGDGSNGESDVPISTAQIVYIIKDTNILANKVLFSAKAVL